MAREAKPVSGRLPSEKAMPNGAAPTVGSTIAAFALKGPALSCGRNGLPSSRCAPSGSRKRENKADDRVTARKNENRKEETANRKWARKAIAAGIAEALAAAGRRRKFPPRPRGEDANPPKVN